MKSKILMELKKGIILFSMIFTVTTILSSFIQLFQGQLTDTNFHIVNRGGVILIAVTTVQLFYKIKLKNKLLSYFLPYAISMTIVFFYVWLTGFITTLHPDAYRDIFLNFTAVSLGVILIIFTKDQLKGNNKKVKP
ncbi:MAG TPA: DUF6608 family protein [Clostridia bacterium]|nr:DUF6608 family protein [Clostridia bacterium]